MSQTPARLRRRFINVKYPLIVLRFEDGHEIHVKKGEGKAFDAFRGETIKILAVWDPTSTERELLEARKGEDFEKEGLGDQ